MKGFTLSNPPTTPESGRDRSTWFETFAIIPGTELRQQISRITLNNELVTLSLALIESEFYH